MLADNKGCGLLPSFNFPGPFKSDRARELECSECKTLNTQDIGRDGYEQGIRRAAEIAESLFKRKSYRSVGTKLARAILAEIGENEDGVIVPPAAEAVRP